MCPYLTVRWVAMVTEGQRVIVLKEKRFLDTWSVSFYKKVKLLCMYYFYFSGLWVP